MREVRFGKVGDRESWGKASSRLGLEKDLKAHLISRDLRLLISRKDLVLWLKENWAGRYSNPVPLKDEFETEMPSFIKEISYKPAVSELSKSLRHVDFLELDHLSSKGGFKIKVPLEYRNGHKLKFGILVINRKFLNLTLRSGCNLPKIEIDLKESITLENRTLRVADLNLPESVLKIWHKSDVVLCKSLKSSKERKLIGQRWLEKRQGRSASEA